MEPSGKPLSLQGVSLGTWLLWKGWEYGKGLNVSETTILDHLSQLVGSQAAADFQQRIFSNFTTEDDIHAIAWLRFNSAQLRVNAKRLEDESRPYVYQDSGWALLDQTLAWYFSHQAYVRLDLHSIPGGLQSAVQQLAPPRASAGKVLLIIIQAG